MSVELVNTYLLVSALLFLGTVLGHALSRFFPRTSAVFIYAVSPLAAHILIADDVKTGRLRLSDVAAIIALGGALLKLKEVLIYGTAVALPILKDLWTVYLTVNLLDIGFLTALGAIICLKTGACTRKLVADKKAVTPLVKLLRHCLRVWLVFTAVYWTVALLHHYVDAHGLVCAGSIYMYLIAYMFSPSATWPFIYSDYAAGRLTIRDVATIFVVGRYLHFLYHAARDMLPAYTVIYGRKLGMRVLMLNVALALASTVWVYVIVALLL